MHTTLIVARMDPTDRQTVAEIFKESDATGLPNLLGVSRRELFSFHDLYFHLIGSTGDIGPKLREFREHELFKDVNTRLSGHIKPYHPTWREPKDAMAAPFYSWSANDQE